MFPVDGLILVAGVLVLFAIASSKLSSRMGLPVLVIFLALGMLAGSEGLGGIEFESYLLAHGVGTLALAVILFDGGLRTPLSSFRIAVGPALSLATVGVVVTALITGLAAAHVLEVPLLEGVLLGSIIGSTDAAAVFSLLRGRGLSLRRRVEATLEIESGSNDPMAVFMTVGILQILTGAVGSGWELAGMLALQVIVGAAAGLVVGKLSVIANNRINLDAAGLYPIQAAAAGLLAYGLAAFLNGSGFLSVYVAGIVIGNSRIVFQRGILLFTDGMAWLGQIMMFIVLGLLVFPSGLIEVASRALLIALVLIFIARPIAVTAILLPFGFKAREIGFLSWIGLKGAVPIILATYPLLFGLPNGILLFNVVFFVVLISALTQGWSLPAIARWLRLERRVPPPAPIALEITSLRHVDGDIVDYAVGPRSRAANRLIRDLALPEGVVVAMLARENRIIPPRGSTRVLAGDHVFVVMQGDVRAPVNRIFSDDRRKRQESIEGFEFPLLPSTTAGDVEEFYGLTLTADGTKTLSELLSEELGDSPRAGDAIVRGNVVLHVREVGKLGIERIGLEIRTLRGE
jgi:cell volume regulation protein A